MYWRAANFVSLCLMSVKSSDFLKGKLTQAHLKEFPSALWGCIPAINMVYAHVSRLTGKYGEKIAVVNGSGHGLEASLANAFLNGSLLEYYPSISEGGLDSLLREYEFNPKFQVAAGCPGTVQSGLELGHSLAHAYGLVLDNPDLIVCCLIGDGEAETGPLTAAWFSHLYRNSQKDGIVLPVINLNGYKSAARTQLSTLSTEQLRSLMKGLGYRAHIVQGTDPELVHMEFAGAMEKALAEIEEARGRLQNLPSDEMYLPCLILKTPKGWTAPKLVGAETFEGTARTSLPSGFRFLEVERDLKLLERWLHSYTPAKVLAKNGTLLPELKTLLACGDARAELAPCTNAGSTETRLVLPEPAEFNSSSSEITMGHLLSSYLGRIIAENDDTFRLFSSHGVNTSYYFEQILENTSRIFSPDIDSTAAVPVPTAGRVMEILSQHTAQGWLEGYIQSGRHGVFLCSEQYVSIVDSMLQRFLQWLADCKKVHWRKAIPSLNYLISSTNWLKGQTDQFMPSAFFNILFDDSEGLTKIYLPADKQTALACLQKVLMSVNCVNAVLVEPEAKNDWLDAASAQAHVSAGIGIWDFACHGNTSRPDLVMLCAGATASEETVAAASIVKMLLPELAIRVVNVCNPKKLLPNQSGDEGLGEAEFNALFPELSPVIAALPWPAGLITTLVSMRFAGRSLKMHHWSPRYPRVEKVPPTAVERFQLVRSVLASVPCDEKRKAAAEANLQCMIEEFYL
ncbi:MAG: hypothetical protein IPK73_16990 [Candidatus Obscuribacter sp.]|nr:hypothetical protein [Candidatus Obscuribacter sp.]MBK9278670.1 hypothetical protein [Candidatus Obscuribacter sp.]